MTTLPGRPTSTPVLTTGTPTPVLTTSRPRLAIALIMLWLPVLALVILGQTLLPRLPDLTASHFGPSGVADGWASSQPYWMWVTVGSAAVALAFTVFTLIPRFDRRMRFMMLLMATWLTALGLGVWWSSAAVTLAAPSPQEAVLGWQLWAALGGSTAWAALLFIAHGRVPSEAREGATPTQPLTIAPGERVAFAASITSRTLAWLSVLVGALAIGTTVAVLVTGESIALVLPYAVVMIAAWLVTLAFARVRLTIDARGLRLVSFLGFTLKRIALDRIASVESIDLEPTDWGGWGYRVMPGRSAFVVRRGPGLAVTLKDDRQFAVTLDDAPEAARVLAGLAAAPL